jgi:hypothetical protein
MYVPSHCRQDKTSSGHIVIKADVYCFPPATCNGTSLPNPQHQRIFRPDSGRVAHTAFLLILRLSELLIKYAYFVHIIILFVYVYVYIHVVHKVVRYYARMVYIITR